MNAASIPAFGAADLPDGIRARLIPNVNGLTMHVLEAGDPGKPCVLLLHGFPELAYSWRRVMPALAEAGFHAVAPDQRGYGRTTGWDRRYDGDLASFRLMNLVRDMLGLLHALGISRTVGVVGHDFGSSVAAWCALLRPDIFPSLTLMSAPFTGPPGLATGNPSTDDLHRALAALDRPRKHYQWYYATREADADMTRCRQGVHDFLRAYFHHKSADWDGNRPERLNGWAAEDIARMPTYYIMDLDRTMAETVAPHMPSPQQIAANRWLPDAELRIYSGEYARNGFQGGLQWYRCRTHGVGLEELQVFHGRTIDVPAMFVSGEHDWGVRQTPGALERMHEIACTAMKDIHLLPGAGHWVQQEQSARVAELLVGFLNRA
jgi:pimeloyl-ACP methyl ester carboxylesterase